MKRAALYLRLSVSDEASTSIARQERDLRALADREGWEVSVVLADDGFSGGSRRDRADEALRLLRTGAVDVLAVWRLDRWTRQGVGALADLLDVLDARPGGLFVALMDGLRSDQGAWRIVAAVVSEVARSEREATSQRVTSSIAALRREGRWSGGTTPYGYRPAPAPDGPGRVLVLDEDEAPILREAADRLLSGQTLYKVATDLQARGVPTRRGAPWSVQALLQMLRSDVLAGRARHPGRRVPVVDDDGEPVVDPRTKKARTRYVRGDLVRDEAGRPAQVWPQLLDPYVWSQVRAVLNADKAPEERPPQRRRRDYLLSGAVTCQQCGAKMYRRSRGERPATYECPSISRGRAALCSGTSIGQEALEGYVVERYLQSIGDGPEFVRRVSTGDETDVTSVEREIRETSAALGDAPEDQYAALIARLSSLRERRDDLRAAPRPRRVELVPTGRSLREAWDETETMEERRAMISARFARISVRKGVKGRHGFDPTRVLLLSLPGHLVGQADDEDWEPGSPVILVDPSEIDEEWERA